MSTLRNSSRYWVLLWRFYVLSSQPIRRIYFKIILVKNHYGFSAEKPPEENLPDGVRSAGRDCHRSRACAPPPARSARAHGSPGARRQRSAVSRTSSQGGLVIAKTLTRSGETPGTPTRRESLTLATQPLTGPGLVFLTPPV